MELESFMRQSVKSCEAERERRERKKKEKQAHSANLYRRAKSSRSSRAYSCQTYSLPHSHYFFSHSSREDFCATAGRFRVAERPGGSVCVGEGPSRQASRNTAAEEALGTGDKSYYKVVLMSRLEEILCDLVIFRKHL